MHGRIVDLETQRAGALQRVRHLITENEKQLASLSATSPNRRLLVVLLKRLRAQADRLEAGLVKPGSRAC